jgi:hypothetical protein
VSEVTDLIEAYRAGELTLDELTQRFHDRAWPAPRPAAATVDELYERDVEDPDAPAVGSFDEVVTAYHAGQITGDEYKALARAVTEAGEPHARG